MPAHYPARHALAPVPRRRWSMLATLAMLAPAPLLAAPSEASSAPAPVSAFDRAMQANDVLMRAISLVGTPYLWGGNTPETGFDCSGLVNYVFRDMLDMRLPRTSRELAALAAPAVEASALASGDLVFFAQRDVVTHVGIYVGDGRFVHAPSSGGTVRLERLDGAYWQARYAGARRVLSRG